MVKNVCGQSVHGTLKLTVVSYAGGNLGKLKVNSMIFGWVWSEMGVPI